MAKSKATLKPTAWIGDDLMKTVYDFARDEIGINDVSVVYLLIRKAIEFSCTVAKDEFKEFLRGK